MKPKVGGKYQLVKREFHPAEAGNKTTGMGGGAPERLGFEGPGTKQFNFTKYVNGHPTTITVNAHSVKEANRIAATRGYKSSDRDVARRNRKRKK